MAEAGTNLLPQACNLVTFLLYQVGKKKKKPFKCYFIRARPVGVRRHEHL